jgi:glycosyltransferase involved in cell wall biosynthesis
MTLQSDPLASVVMAVFNGERFLREAMESILSQTFRDFEFIIIDDGSTDRTASILAEYERSDPRVRVYHQQNRGIAESGNRGCRRARGRYILRMDQDDVSVPERLERQAGFLEKNPEVGLLGGAFEAIDEQGRQVFVDRPPLEDGPIRAAFRSLSYPMCHPAVAMRKQAFDATGGYRAQFLHGAEDYDLFLRIIESWKVANLPEVVLRKRVHSNQASVAHLGQSTLYLLAAHALAAARERGSAEPPFDGPVISEGYLEKLGISQAERLGALANTYLYYIDYMSQASQDGEALRLVDELMALAKSGPVNKTNLSDAMLWAARIHYRHGRPVRALECLARALRIRPEVAGRPLKRAVNSIFRKSQAQAGRA